MAHGSARTSAIAESARSSVSMVMRSPVSIMFLSSSAVPSAR